MPGEELNILNEIPGAEGIWEAFYSDEETHDSTAAFIKKGCKSAEAKAKFEEAEEKYKAGEIGPCVYVERMIVFEMPRGGGVVIYSPIPITDDMKTFVDEQGGCKAIVAPTSEHSLYVGGWMEAYPDATVVCPGGDAMASVIEALGDRAKVCDSRFPAKWDKAAIKVMSGISFDVLDWAGFQEILLLHRKSKTFMACDCTYLGCSDKFDKAGWKNLASEVWQELYFEAYMAKSESFMPIYRTLTLTPEQKMPIAKMLKKVLGSWKPERVTSARAGKTSEGGAAEAQKIMEGHWGL